MSETMDRRTFLGQAARAAAAGTMMGCVKGPAAETRPATGPAMEWRNKQPTMAYARLGRTNFMVSRCVFGAGGLYDAGGDLRLLEIAIDRGMNYIDTGRAYRRSESAIAGIVKKCREKVWIVSKAGHIGWPDMTVKRGQDAKAAGMYTEQLDESLRRLQTDHVDCYMIQGAEHDWIVTMDSLYEAFTKARKAGKVRHFGLATHTNVPKVCELAAASGRYDLVMLAVNPNSLKSLSPAVRTMREAGIGVVAMKGSGLIARNPKAYDGHYHQMFAGQKLSPFQRAHAYLLFRGNIDAFNSHMPTRRILEENLAVPTLKLGRAELDRIEKQALAEARGSCRHCGNCTRACPERINVADLLRYHAYVHHYRERDAAKAMYERLGKAQARLCTNCGVCRAACPESIDLPAVISSLRIELA